MAHPDQGKPHLLCIHDDPAICQHGSTGGIIHVLLTMVKRGREERRGPPRQFDHRQARKQADRLENDGVEGDFNIW